MAGSNELLSIDKHFGRLISRLSGAGENVFWAAALVSMETRNGHVCIDLSDWSGLEIEVGENENCRIPVLSDWLAEISSSPAVGDGGEATPLVLENNRLYLHRYWEYERDVARFIVDRSRSAEQVESIDGLSEIFDRLFPDPAPGCDYQILAALAVILSRFVVIAGGPGTGKTTTVAKIIALLLERFSGDDADFRIALAAPTGKAVMRLQQVMASIKKTLACSETVREKIPTEVVTVHRLLGPRKDSPFFFHDENNPLSHDLLIIDEASMVDLPLMAKLMRALGPETRLVLLGDRNQLASVEPGAVLGDICEKDALEKFSAKFIELASTVTDVSDLQCAERGLGDTLVELQVSHRFGSESGIGLLSRAVNRGDDEEVKRILRDGGYPDVLWRDIGDEMGLRSALVKLLDRSPPEWLKMADPLEALTVLGHSQILCAVRYGDFGIKMVNKAVEEILSECWEVVPLSMAYHGRPVLISENHYDLQLFNGDTGLVLADRNKEGELYAYFRKGDNEVRRIPLAMLPEHETSFAITVHKSQGSEFDEVVLILPDKHYPVLTRELLYTALTRARRRVEIWGNVEVMKKMLSSVVARHGGLRGKISLSKSGG